MILPVYQNNLAFGKLANTAWACPKKSSLRLPWRTPIPTFPHFEVQKWGKGKRKRPGRGAFGCDGRGQGLRMWGKRIPQKARDRRVRGVVGCKSNNLIDFPAFCARMNMDLSRDWEDVCGGRGSAA
jgi:hypothetical protein